MTSSQKRVLSIAKYIQLLRIIICLATVLNIVVLTRSLQHLTHEEDGAGHGKYPGSSFVVTPHIILNGGVLVGTVILLKYPGGRNHGVRLPLVTMGFITGLFAALFPLITIASHGGCSSSYYSKVTGICGSQFIAGWSTLTWVAALFWETVMSYTEQQRSGVLDIAYAPFEK